MYKYVYIGMCIYGYAQEYFIEHKDFYFPKIF